MLLHQIIHWQLVLIASMVYSVCSQTTRNQTHLDGIDSDASFYFSFNDMGYPKDCNDVSSQCSDPAGIHIIKPDGYPEPFHVYCGDTLEDGGWTIIQRRHSGSTNFNRSWEDYELGFGFLSSDFWLGNKKLSYLTNQKNYQLCIEMTTIDGTSFNVIYNNFRITDGFGRYELVSVGTMDKLNGTIPEWCPTNMKYDTCTCQTSREEPGKCVRSCTTPESCVCPNGYRMNGTDCIPRELCGCFLEDENTVLSEGEISQNCDRNCSCISGRLKCVEFHCSPNAACVEGNRGPECYCNDRYGGNGKQCSRLPSDCKDIYDDGQLNSGVYTIHLTNYNGLSFDVYCNMSDGGGWTVFQRRADASVNFNRNWNDYKNGFGSPDRDVWLGNDKLFYLTNQRMYQLRIDLVSRDGTPYYAKYTLFRINSEIDNYTLSKVEGYSGNTGDDDRLGWHKDAPFSTPDRDNDRDARYDCAGGHRGGWWFAYRYIIHGTSCNRDDICDYVSNGKSCYSCGMVYLNGDLNVTTRGTNLFWNNLGSGYECGMQYAEMKIRPV